MTLLASNLWEIETNIPSGYRFTSNSLTPIGLSGGLTFTRTGAVSTRGKPDGLLEIVGPNIPRFTHDPLTGVSRGIVIEPDATNLLQFPEALDNAVWDAPSNNGAVTPNVATDQFGNLKFDRLASDGTNDRRRQTVAHTSGSGQWFSHGAVAKSATSKVFEIRIGLEGGTTPIYTTVQINASTGAVTRTEGVGQFGAIEFPGYYRLWCSVTDNASGNNSKFTQPRCATSGQSVDIGGFQLEPTLLSTYIPSDGPQVTRTKDLLTAPRTIQGGMYSAVIEAIMPLYTTAAFTRLLTLHDGSVSNRVDVRRNPNTNAITLHVVAGVVNVASLTSSAITGGTRFKAAFAVAANNFALAVTGGVAALTDTAGALPPVTTLNIGSYWNSVEQWGGQILSFKEYNGILLSDAELQKLVAL
jgi:hypothetical protein